MSTESALKALSNSQLASGTEIPATKHRTVNDAIIEELFDAQSRGDVLSAVQTALAIASGDKVLVIRGGAAFLLDADEFGFISNLVDLDDVNIPSPLNNQIIVWDSATSKFVAKDLSGVNGNIAYTNVDNNFSTSQTITGNLTATGTVTATGGNSTEWNTAYDWVNTNSANVALKNVDNNFSTSQTINGNLTVTNPSVFSREISIERYALIKDGNGNTTGIFADSTYWTGSGNNLAIAAETGKSIGFFTNGSAAVGMSLSTTNNLSVTGSVTATSFIGDGRTITNSVIALGTNPTAYDLLSKTKARFTVTYTATNTLTFSNASVLEEFTMQLTNTNANVITFAGITLYFKAGDLPFGVTFASNALTFPADSSVKYNIVGVAFNGSTFDCKIEIR